jgi:osmotically-inducible protein OsmY
MFGHEEMNNDGLALLPPRPAQQASPAEFAERQLRSSPYLALRNLGCDFHDGVLVLRGCLPTYYLKQMAQAAVSHVAGVEQVVNQIEVVPAAALALRR